MTGKQVLVIFIISAVVAIILQILGAGGRIN